MSKIGFFGGTFDPIHNGHISLARAVKNEFDLDRIILIPSGDSYMKDNVSPAKMRVDMVDAAIDDAYGLYEGGWLIYSTCEVVRGGFSYMIDTIREIDNKRHNQSCGEYYNCEMYWILGADAFMSIEKWHEWQDILDEAGHIVVVGRPTENNDAVKLQIRRYEASGYKSKFHFMEFDCPISSTIIRNRIANGLPYDFYVSPCVREYIEQHELYQPNFNAKKAKEYIVQWIRNKVTSLNPNGKVVIGISGGKDSSVVAALCVEALGRDRVYGVLMPNGEQKDISDAYEVCRLLGFKHYTINIEETFTSVVREVYDNVDTPTEIARINIAPRLRMTYLYAVAQTLGNAFVINTCNLSEDWVGYSTWHGDSAGDFSPLSQYTSEEVMAIGVACGLPRELAYKTPADGLCGKTDEDNLGFTYHELNEYIRGREEPRPEIKEIIDKKHAANLFKLQPLDSCPYKG